MGSDFSGELEAVGIGPCGDGAHFCGCQRADETTHCLRVIRNGDTDVATANQGSSNVTLLFNDGTGTLRDRTDGREKAAWILAVIFISWFAWVFYALLAPLRPRPRYP